ncbi:Glucokinase [Candidatus Izimaplasma bacterium HR1]|jgi:glucokinase|uniref:ROK family glucokinase n=1 Tax=Candidatus Izimoplasma sp. HR1 TaxID=1541959 RepID=UPI0004F84B60|nr:Glucokinase [Candidatus Izimaplasma bacterium HR1]
MKKYVYGIDIGGTTIKMGLFNQDTSLLEKWEIKTSKTNDGRNVINDIYQSIIKKTPNLQEVIGYGFGVPGPVIKNNVSVVVNLGWKDVNLKNEFKDLLENDNICVGNDANVATLGEAFYGAGKGKKQVAMLTLGTGVGGGIVVDGNVVEGYNGAAGEIGHLYVSQEYEFACNCGKKGCLETVASATGIRNLYYKMKESFQGNSTLEKLELPSAKAIFSAAKHNDELASKVVEEASKNIGYACAILSVASNPEVIIIGGGVSKSGEFLFEKVRRYFKKFTFVSVENTKIVGATLGNDAGIYGAARMVING